MAKSSMLLCVGLDAGSLLPAPYLDAWGEEVGGVVWCVVCDVWEPNTLEGACAY